MWRIVLVFSHVSLSASVPLCTNNAGESVECANLILDKFGLPQFLPYQQRPAPADEKCHNDDGEEVPCINLKFSAGGIPFIDSEGMLYPDQPCYNKDGEGVDCHHPGIVPDPDRPISPIDDIEEIEIEHGDYGWIPGGSHGPGGYPDNAVSEPEGPRHKVSNEGWCSQDEHCWSNNCCQNYCKNKCPTVDIESDWDKPSTQAPEKKRGEGDPCTHDDQCSKQPYRLICNKQSMTCRECESHSDCKAAGYGSGYKCVDFEEKGLHGMLTGEIIRREKICLPDDCSADKRCYHELKCCRRLGNNECHTHQAFCLFSV